MQCRHLRDGVADLGYMFLLYLKTKGLKSHAFSNFNFALCITIDTPLVYYTRIKFELNTAIYNFITKHKTLSMLIFM